MRLFSRLLITGLALCFLASAALHRMYFVDRSDVLEGKNLGSAGPYERIVAKAHFLVDPKLPANRIITDIDLAPRDENGMVAFSADVCVLKPRDPAKGNGTLILDIVNRGHKVVLGTFDDGGGNRDPATGEVFGDAFLLQRGFTVAWVGWQFDVPKEPGRMRLTTPVAKNPDGSPITGLVRADFVPDSRVRSHSLADRGHIAYPVLDPKDETIRLTVRDRIDAPRHVIPRDQWQFAREENGKPVPDTTHVYMASGFEPGKVYEVVYTAKDPPLVGLGMAAIRDFIAYMKFGTVQGGPVFVLADQRHHIKRVMGFGSSQSGRFLRTFLYYGFNRDEKGRQVFDGVWAHVAGGGRGSFNHRFAQPSRDASPHANFLYPTDIFPFTDLDETDPVTGLTEGILTRARRDNVVPKIFYTNTSCEYWNRAASLIHTTVDGTRDAPLAPNTRLYVFAGAQHGSRNFPPRKSATRYFTNPNNYRWAMRALLVAFNRWLSEGAPPPPSRYPTIANRQLVPPEKVNFPSIPGVEFPATRLHKAYRVDYGPDFRTKGIVSIEPPKVGPAFGMRVPQVDSDGNDTGGIRLPVVAAALGTFTGWNLRTEKIGAPHELYSLTGAYLPFAFTKAQRETSRDPRPSVEERYAGREKYTERLRTAAEALVEDGYLLKSDLWRILRTGEAQWDFVAGLGKGGK